MKTSHVIIFLAIIGIVGVSSCSKKADDITPIQPLITTTTPVNSVTTTQAGFRVKINGKDYAPDFSYALASFPGDNGYYAVYGLDSKTSDVVALALPSIIDEGTYPINNVNIGIVTVNKEDFSTVNAGNGTVTIIRKTATNVVGTFSFTAYDATGEKKVGLTEGTFNVLIK